MKISKSCVMGAVLLTVLWGGRGLADEPQAEQTFTVKVNFPYGIYEIDWGVSIDGQSIERSKGDTCDEDDYWDCILRGLPFEEFTAGESCMFDCTYPTSYTETVTLPAGVPEGFTKMSVVLNAICSSDDDLDQKIVYGTIVCNGDDCEWTDKEGSGCIISETNICTLTDNCD